MLKEADRERFMRVAIQRAALINAVLDDDWQHEHEVGWIGNEQAVHFEGQVLALRGVPAWAPGVHDGSD